jgi:cytidylate kinase
MKRLNIAIDGPAGAGKSTIAKALAAEMNIRYLDTGAMYRAMAVCALRAGVDPRDAETVARILPQSDVQVRYDEKNQQRVYLNGEDVTGELRTPSVSRGASDIAVHPAVRVKLVELQRQVARDNDVVMDGRDIGTYVLPDTPYKFYVDASPRERAKRRLLELQQKGQAPDTTVEQMEREILARDATDSSREFAPLRRADDAIYIDTTDMSIEQAIAAVRGHIR